MFLMFIVNIILQVGNNILVPTRTQRQQLLLLDVRYSNQLGIILYFV